ncbi:uncharacterized protein GIQ15_03769 [Arthroderma uncinatum]|uniref:uncharacterized protein n=1 Tax=Arthroderma uncinatum TaxID=74035 RepID=UPI00144A4E55|nr:uncharacterized protein GIQ15_03769 [Arthroderma uncinatum]KAF3484445.1 hypothetical protein GIQ15_03769 [Arthroderma uncinatum]
MSGIQLAALTDTLHTWYSNLTTNVSTSVTNLTLRDYIRLVWIIGGYYFLRPYLDKGFKKLLDSGNKKAEAEEAAAEDAAVRAKLSANALRDGGNLEESEEEDDEGESTGVSNWGKSARRKQRNFMKFLEQEGERKRAEDDDKDIADLLED